MSELQGELLIMSILWDVKTNGDEWIGMLESILTFTFDETNTRIIGGTGVNNSAKTETSRSLGSNRTLDPGIAVRSSSD